MKTVRNLFACAVVVTVLSGCAGMGEAMMMDFSLPGTPPGEYTKIQTLSNNGRHDEVDKFYTQKLLVNKKLNTNDRFWHCKSLLQLKNFNRLFSCIDKLEAGLAAGDVKAIGVVGGIAHEPALLRAKGHIELSQLQQATQHARVAYQLVKDSTLFVADGYRLLNLHVLGLSLALDGNREEALATIKLLSEISTSGLNTGLYRSKITALAQIYVALKEFKLALKIIEDYDPSWWNVYMDNSYADLGMTNAYLKHPHNFISAKIFLENGNLKEAKRRFDLLLSDPTLKPNRTLYWQTLYERARIASVEGNQNYAVKLMKESVDVIETQRKTIGTEASKIGFIGDKQGVYNDLVATLIKVGRVIEAFEYAERGKARALVDILASKKTFSSSQTPAQVNNMLAALDDAEFKSLIIASAQASDTATRGISLKTQVDQILTAAPETGSLISVSTMKTIDIQRMLKSDEAIVEYFYQGDGDVFAFVVSRSSVKAFTLDGKGLNREVKAFRNAIDARTGNDWKQWSDKLYSRLMKPVKNAIKGKKHLTIVPHGVLHYLPFNALKSANNKMLIEQYTIRLLPSASVMKFLNKPSNPTQNLLVFGNPVRNDAPALPGAESEAKAVAKLWKKSRIILRSNASETLMKQSASSFRYIHLASHGQFKPDAPMESRMLLSADNENDGNLTVSEIYDLNLNADMVVLSACQTGLGDVKNGDDVLGLNRGFLYAGAKSIVASLWDVPDNPTKELMTRFYKNLKNRGMRTAMQRAQLAAYKKYNHPIYWAAFQMTGGE